MTTNAVPKWNDERTAALEAAVGTETPITKATVDRVAAELSTTGRSIASKLRKLGYEVEKASESAKAFSDEQEEALRELVEANDGAFTYAELAAQFEEGAFSAKAVQGKILSMQLTGSVKPTPKAESTKTYTDAEQATIVNAINAGDYLEDISAAVNRPITSVRGKALSLLRQGEITAMPKQRDVKGAAPDAFATLGDVSAMTVAQIAEALGKTDRGVKTMLTRRGISASDHDGAAKKEKAAK